MSVDEILDHVNAESIVAELNAGASREELPPEFDDVDRDFYLDRGGDA